MGTVPASLTQTLALLALKNIPVFGLLKRLKAAIPAKLWELM